MKIKVKDLKRSQNIVDYCATYMPRLGSKTAARKAIEKNQLKVNRQKVTPQTILKNGDWIELKIKNKEKKHLVNLQIPIVYEDEYLVIVNKPGGIAVNGNRNKTVENGIRTLIQPSQQKDAFSIPVAAHRLDVPTKGLVVLAKTKTALVQINKAFQRGAIQKEYVAVVHGKPEATGRITLPIQGKNALTEFELLRSVPSKIYQHMSLLRLQLLTGRTHQLRIHLQSIGHLVVGDKQYAGQQKTILGKGVFLCAYKLAFTHPINGTSLQLEIKPPARFNKLLDREEQRF